MMKKILILVMGASLIAMASFSGFVMALDNDTFTVTASGAYLECNIINTTWAIGTVVMSHSYWTNETGKTQTADVTNCTAGTNIDFEMTVSSDSAIWKINTAPAADKYQMNASSGGWGTQVKLQSVVYGDVHSNHDPATDIPFDLRFDSPTSTTTGTTQTITLTGKVTVT